ncbi:MAG TPA: hypothetical protein VGM75_27430 [Pseudonocardiaceae bacterium]
MKAGLPYVWGATDEEIAAGYGCDSVLPAPGEALLRAVTVGAPATVVYRWLCQLKIAPYSYDLLDNFGRRSPRILTPGAERLEIGQPVMTIFKLVGFSADEELTLRMHVPSAVRLFGDLAVSYRLFDNAPASCRLVAKLVLDGRPGLLADLRRQALAWGDLLMMRKQLNTLRQLAETSYGTI